MCVVGIVFSPRRDAGARFFLSPAGVPPCSFFPFRAGLLTARLKPKALALAIDNKKPRKQIRVLLGA